MKIKYNSPVILTYSIISFIVISTDHFLMENFIESFFTLYPQYENFQLITIFRLFSYVCGHADWAHFAGNFYLILLIGPVLEEKYGSRQLGIMMLATALLTGILTITLFSYGVLGASGIVFMLIILSSVTNFKKGELPVTFVLVVFLYLGKEIIQSLNPDQVSQFGHIIGGIFGGIFGFFYSKNKA